jgi:hypothetical protein
MKTASSFAVAVILGALVSAQEKPVPKDSTRVSIPGCVKGVVFTVVRVPEGEPVRSNVPPGTHYRMSGPKKLVNDIKAHEGSLIEITGLVRKNDERPEGVKIGGVRITPGPAPGSSVGRDPMVTEPVIDVEGYRPLVGDCPVK